MSDTLRDQLLGLGFKPAAQARAHRCPTVPANPAGRPHGSRGNGLPRPGRDGADRRTQGSAAYKPARCVAAGPARARTSTWPRPTRSARRGKGRAHRGRARQAGRGAPAPRGARPSWPMLVKDKALNVADAEHRAPFRIRRQDQAHARHRRAAEGAQRRRAGRAAARRPLLLVAAELLARPRRSSPACVALKVDPDAPAGRRSLRRSEVPGARRPGLVRGGLKGGISRDLQAPTAPLSVVPVTRSRHSRE